MGSWGSSSEVILAEQFPLHRACRDGDVGQVSALLGEFNEHGPSNGLFQEDTFYGWTPAHWASYFGKLPCLVRLIEHGEVSCNISTFRFHQSPLHIAAFGGHGHCVQWLLQRGSQINRQLACLRRVLSCGDDALNVATSRFQQGPCHLAAFAGHPQCLSWLIQAGGNVNLQDYLGETPLHKAARTGSMECVSLLVSQGASISNTNFNNQTPAQLALACNFPECASYLDRAMELQRPPRAIFQDLLPTVTHAPALDKTSVSTIPSDSQTLAVISQGLNGGTIPTFHSNGFSNGVTHGNDGNDDSMDTDEPAINKNHISNGGDSVPNGDVLLMNGVCINHVPVAGRKRGREEVDEECLKRIKTGDMPMIPREEVICVDGVEAVTVLPTKFINPNIKMNGSGDNGTSNGWHWDNTGRFPQKERCNGWSLQQFSTESSVSALEHRTSVHMQEGYDSLVVNSLISYTHGQ